MGFVIIDLFSNLQITERGGGVCYYRTREAANRELRKIKAEDNETGWRFEFEEFEDVKLVRTVQIPTVYKVLDEAVWKARGRVYYIPSHPRHPNWDARYWYERRITQGVDPEHIGKLVINVMIEKMLTYVVLEDGTKTRVRGTFCY